MEPRSAERGNAPLATCLSRYRPLQWSHAQPNVETAQAAPHAPLENLLQWSHAQPNVETGDRYVGVAGAPAGRFNGATLSRTWKL